MKVAMNGASGFVAKALKKAFPDNIVIERNDSVEAILTKLEGVEAVFNLAGAPIAARWDEAYKKVLFSSRIESTKKIVAAINQSEVKHFISTSAVGIYPNNVPSDESSEKFGDDFLAGVCIAWENEARKCQKPTTILRFGVVLGKEGGALEKMVPAFQAWMGGIIGNGMMMTSWIDIDDLVRIYSYVLEQNIVGTYNATAPNPVSNFTFTKSLGKVLNRPTWLPLPAFVIKMLFSEGACVLLDSKEVYPKALLDKGFTFAYPDINSSLKKILT
ncbi:MAG: TIGR01777 family oxidoreductase [Sulfurospirillaceae bacterium]|nr:TIGR01777 family oxidoreductase [Sulfurospirillaceae bacterium]